MERSVAKNPMVALFVKACVTAYIITAILLLIISFLMLKMNLSATVVSVFIIITYIVSNLVCGVIIGKRMEHRRFLWGMAGGLIYFLILLAGSLIFTRVGDFNVFYTIRTLAICALAGMAGGMIS